MILIMILIMMIILTIIIRKINSYYYSWRNKMIILAIHLGKLSLLKLSYTISIKILATYIAHQGG